MLSYGRVFEPLLFFQLSFLGEVLLVSPTILISFTPPLSLSHPPANVVGRNCSTARSLSPHMRVNRSTHTYDPSHAHEFLPRALAAHPLLRAWVLLDTQVPPTSQSGPIRAKRGETFGGADLRQEHRWLLRHHLPGERRQKKSHPALHRLLYHAHLRSPADLVSSSIGNRRRDFSARCHF